MFRDSRAGLAGPSALVFLCAMSFASLCVAANSRSELRAEEALSEFDYDESDLSDQDDHYVDELEDVMFELLSQELAMRKATRKRARAMARKGSYAWLLPLLSISATISFTSSRRCDASAARDSYAPVVAGGSLKQDRDVRFFTCLRLVWRF